MSASAPTQADYLATFIRDVMGITTAELPDNSPVIAASFSVALAIVSLQLQQIDPFIYQLAVYNLAGDRLLNWAPDVPSGPTYGEPPIGYFANLRRSFTINTFVAGVIQSAGDESTNESLVVPESLKNLTLMDLQNLKTPYGRTYLSFAQQIGTLWGLT